MSATPKRRGMTTIRRKLMGNLLLVIALVVIGMLVGGYWLSSMQVSWYCNKYIHRTLQRLESELDGLFKPVEHSLKVARDWGRMGLLDLSQPDLMNALFVPILEQQRRLSGVVSGNTEGDGWFLMHQGTGWQSRLTRVKQWGQTHRYKLWTDALTLERSWDDSEQYDPRIRPWFENAITEPNPESVCWTKPYLFHTLQEPGITASIRFNRKDVNAPVQVIAYDMLLKDISLFTTGLEVTERGLVFVMTEDRELIGLPRDERFSDMEVLKKNVLTPFDRVDIPVLVDARKAWVKQDKPRGVFRFNSGGERWWATGRWYELGNQKLWMGVVVPESDMDPYRSWRTGMQLAIGIAALLIAMLLAARIAREMGKPLELLVDENNRISKLELDNDDPVQTDVLEINALAQAQQQMRATLRSFARYVPVELVRQLVQQGQVARIGGRSDMLAVLFTDIVGFTRISETMSPQALTDHMADYFEHMLAILEEHGATIDKFVGDAIVAFWGAPIPDAQGPHRAVLACLHCARELANLNEQWEDQGLPALPTCFGLNAGDLVVGNVGSRRRLSYTVLGDQVNLAARIEGLNRYYQTKILVTDKIRQLAGEDILWRYIDKVTVKGKSDVVDIYEPIGLISELDQPVIDRAEQFGHAVRAYQQQHFAEALVTLEHLSEQQADPAVDRLLKICRQYQEHPPGGSWNGVTVHETK